MLVKIMVSVDQHQPVHRGIAGHGTLLRIAVDAHIDRGYDVTEGGTGRVSLVEGEIAVKIACNVVSLVDDGVGNGVVLATGYERVDLFVIQRGRQGASLIDGVTQL